MRWVDISVKKKLYTAFFLGILVVWATMGFLLHNLVTVSHEAEVLSEPPKDGVLLAAEVNHLLWGLSVQDFILQQGQAPLGVPTDATQCAFGKWFYGAERRALEEDVPSMRPIFTELDGVHRNLHQSAADIVREINNKDIEKAKTILNNTTIPSLHKVQNLLTKARQQSTSNKDYLLQHVADTVENMWGMALGVALLFTVGGFFLTMLLVRNICYPLNTLSLAAQRVGAGFYETVSINQHDEIGEVAKAFNTATEIIKEKFGVTEGIMRGMTMAFAACDTSGKITFVNQLMLDLWGREGKPEDYFGVHVSEFYYQDRSHPTLFDTIFEELTPIIGYAATRTNAKGEIKFLVMDLSPLRDLDGNVIGAFTLHSDLTEMHEQRERIAQLNDRIYLSANKAQEISSMQSQSFTKLFQQLENTGRMAQIQAQEANSAMQSMQRMTDSMQEVALKTAESMEKSQLAQREAEEGYEVVRRTIACIDKVDEQTAKVAQSMSALDRQANEIGNVLGLIKDVADQTNLLALNAAIEAARAGEAGKGFAVVADEVRKLAEKTMHATDEVADSISGIQASVRDSAKATNEAVTLTRQATELADSSGTRLSNIQSVIGEAVVDIASVSQVTSEQAEATTEVLQQIERFTEQAHNATQTMHESVDYASKLHKLSDDLRHMIDAMRSERRGDTRFGVTEPHMFHLIGTDGSTIEVDVIDVSVSGMRAHCDSDIAFHEGDKIKLVASDEPFNHLFVNTDAQIVWVDGKLMGLTFSRRYPVGQIEEVVRQANRHKS